jgi:UDP-N-acetylglucosamine diphosphorylase/glucosamine-1-phosphate N-acetyltransferase
MNIILHDRILIWEQLLPFTFTRPVAEIRCGILTIREKWEHIFSISPTFSTVKHLQNKYSCKLTDDNLIIASHILPDDSIVSAIMKLNVGESLKQNEQTLAIRLNHDDASVYLSNEEDRFSTKSITYQDTVSSIDFPWHIFQWNGQEIEKDFSRLTTGRHTAPISSTNRILGMENVFAEEGVQMEYVTINAQAGKVYLGRNAVIMENTSIRNSFAACMGAEVKMSAKIYGPTTFGPYAKVGGEVNNSVIFGYSNKAHDGFLGNSVIGEWCNLGADTNNSNLKNDYSQVKLWSYKDQRFINTGLQFCGLMMADHSKCGINTMFNTGTVVGVSCNIFGDGFPRNIIPSFSWGGASGFTEYKFDKAIKVAQLVMQRRNIELSEEDIAILKWVYDYPNR